MIKEINSNKLAVEQKKKVELMFGYYVSNNLLTN